MVTMTDIGSGAQCVLLGVKDSITGMWPVFHLVRQNEKMRKQLLQCFLLNGVILLLFAMVGKGLIVLFPDPCLGALVLMITTLSILIFDYVFLPAIQYTAGFIYGIFSDPSESGMLLWLSTILSSIFTGLWVLPVFWISKPINSIWFMDIASAAFAEAQKSKKTKTKPHHSSGQSLSQVISRFIADLLFSVVLEMFFLVQAMVVGMIPGVGWILSLFHMAVLYALYSFEYKWLHIGTIVHQRVAYIEKNWPYFLGFGLPLAIVTALPHSLVISACIFAVAFPLFIVSAYEAQPAKCPLPPIPIFKVVVVLSNKLFNKSDPTPSTPSRSTTTR